MRPLVLLGAGAVCLLGLVLGACDQDYAASNADRHSFMGAVHAAPLPSAAASAEPLPPPALPTTTAPAAPSASAAPAPSATPAPAGSGKH